VCALGSGEPLPKIGRSATNNSLWLAAGSPPGAPPTLDHLAQQAVGIEAECESCHRKVVVGFEQFLPRYGLVTFPAFTKLLKCSACGSRQVFARDLAEPVRKTSGLAASKKLETGLPGDG
jgi:hypothetical protein